MRVSKIKVGILAAILTLSVITSAQAEPIKEKNDLGLCPIKQSSAYQNFQKRSVCELSKLLYLIERFKSLPLEIDYEGRRYKIKDVAGVANAFLRFNFRKEHSAKDWLMRYANRTLFASRPILLRLEDGKTADAGQILMRELENLEKVLAEPKIMAPVVIPVAETAISPASGSVMIGPEQFDTTPAQPILH